MPTRELLTPAQRTQLNEIPEELSQRELSRYYTFSNEEIEVVNRHRGAANRLGFAVQLGFLRYPGRPLSPQEDVPLHILAHIGQQLGISPAVMQDYARIRDTTRREHLAEIRRVFGYRVFTLREYRELNQWLLPTALSTDKGILLVEALIQEMRNRKIIVPGITTVERFAWFVRHRAENLVYKQLTQGLTAEQCTQLDKLLTIRTGGRQTYLVWLRQPPESTSNKSFHELMDRRDFIKNLQLPLENGRRVHQNRLTQLAREGSRYSAQHLARFNDRRRYATLMAFLHHTYAALTDHGLDAHDKLIGRMFNRGEHTHKDQFQRDGKLINEKVRLYAQIGKVLISARDSKQDPFELLQSVIAWDRFVATVEEAEQLTRSENFDYLGLLDRRYQQLRKYAPRLLDSYDFRASASPSAALLGALHLLKEMNASGKRKIPDDAPVEFVKPRWEKYVIREQEIDRHYYEICALAELRNHLRSGDIWVTGSRQFKDFDEYLLPTDTWMKMKVTGKLPLSVDTNVEQYLEDRIRKVETELLTVSELIRKEQLPDVSLSGGILRVSPLKKMVPDGVEELIRRTYDLLPRIKLTDLLVEVDGWTQFSRHFTRLHSNAEVKDKSVLFAAILADGINLGLAKMADACPGISFDQLAWVSDWYIRDDTYSKALAEIVDFHHKHPFASHWGDGTTSSSDGQRFKAGSRSGPTAQVNAKYGQDPGVTFYTHISDQYSPYHVKVISSTAKDAPYVLDGLLYHETELNIEEHYTDTAGYTDHVFAMCHLLGFRFAPRIRDLGDKRMYSFGKPTEYPDLAPLLGGKIDTRKIRDYWDDVLRLATSIKRGTVTASLILGKLSSYPRQNGLAWALREIGRIEKTLFTLEWLHSPELRRRVQIGLNKGEAKHALARAVFFNRLGEIRDRSYEDQMYRASGLQLVVAAIVLWNTAYLSRAVDTLRDRGYEIPSEYLQHLSPLGWEHITLTGDYVWNLKQRTDINHPRPLREKSALMRLGARNQ